MCTILIVEDEELSREMIAEGLRRRGYEILTVGDGHEALKMSAKHDKQIHLMLCEVKTPGLRLRELIRIAVGMSPNMRVLR